MKRLATISAVLMLAVTTTSALAEADIAKGEKAFRKCASCHSVEPEAAKRAGPNLYGIVDRPVASLEGFTYSDALKAGGEAGDIWDEERLSGFIANPKSMYKGHKMAFAGIRKETELVDLIGFLKAQAPEDDAAAPDASATPQTAPDASAPPAVPAAPAPPAPAQ